MKALRLHARGGPEQIVYEEAPIPADPGAGEVRVRVHATGITPTELTWDETYTTADGKSRVPSIPGHELSGVVDATGPGVSDLRGGDAVYGLTNFDRDGCAAEFVNVAAGNLAPKPKSLDHVHTATLPLSALTAWQALFHHARLEPGQTVLIHGAAGGVGAFVVQLAKWQRARVVATASARHGDFLNGLGVDQLIDYHASQFEDLVHDVDLVIDPIGGQTQARSWRVLKPGGLLISLNSPATLPPEMTDRRGIFFIVEPSRSDLIEITKLVEAGTLRTFLNRVFPLSQGKQAFQYATTGHLQGKIVVQVLG